MAINPSAKYANIDTTDPAYPLGKARNVVVKDDGTGTPFDKDWLNDLFGFQQALLAEAGISATGTPDTATASQYLDAIQSLIASGVSGVQSYSDLDALKAAEIDAGKLGVAVRYCPSGDVVQGLIYLCLTPAQYGGVPDGYIDHYDAAGNVLALIVNGAPTVEQSGGVSLADATNNIIAANIGAPTEVYGQYLTRFIPANGYLENGVIGNYRKSELDNQNADEATVQIASTDYVRPSLSYVKDLSVTGNNADPTNNYPDIGVWGEYTHVIGNYVHDVSSGVLVSYLGEDSAAATAAFGGTIAQFTSNTPVTQPERGSHAAIVAFNDVVDSSIIGYQIFCTDHTRVIGNSNINETPSTQHGYRFTGYGGWPTRFNSASGNTAKNVQNGVSVQLSASYNSLSGFAIEEPTNAGLSLNVNTSLADWHNSHNYLQGVSKGGEYGVYAAKPNYNHIQWIVDEADTFGAYLDASGTYGDNKLNLVDMVITNSAEGAFVNSSYNNLRLLMSQINGRGVVVSGSYNIIEVICDTPSVTVNTFALQVSGSYNTIRIVSAGNANTADISVSGSDNIIDCMCSKSIVCTGNNNIFRGRINTVGSTSISSTGTGNDFTGIKNASGMFYETGTTNVNGDITVTSPTRPGGLNYNATAIVTGTTLAGHTVNYVSAPNSSSFTFRVYDASGTPLASTSVTLVCMYSTSATYV